MPPVCRPATKAVHLCAVPFCRKRRAKGKSICPKHHTDWYRATHPVAYFYNLLRARARRRKVLFNLSLSEFAKFCEDTDYLAKKGRFASDLSIDRKREHEPYQADNIQVLTVGENVSKIRAFEAVQRKIHGTQKSIASLDTSKPARTIFAEVTLTNDGELPW